MGDSLVFEGKNRVYLTGHAQILTQDMEVAWAEKHIQKNPSLSWILGKYVEAEQPNLNRQKFWLTDLQDQATRSTLNYGPLNMNHTLVNVGTVVATELLYPTTETAESQYQNAYVEALSAFWKLRCPNEFAKVEQANAQGQLFYSQESAPETIGCGKEGCGGEFAYDGRTSPTYCSHLNDFHETSDRILNKPTFYGAGLIIPPHQPGWNLASIDEISALGDEVERTFEEAKSRFGLTPLEAENLIKGFVALDALF